MAIGAVAALRAKGLKVPRDVMVAGFDDIETLQDFRPPLTTVHLPLEELGRLAALGGVEVLGEDAPARPRVTGNVILRRSTGTGSAAHSAGKDR